MASKRKFKRDYIILEAKDTEFRYKDRILPKAFAKVEINEEKSIVSLYVENLKCVKDGYRVVAIQSDYETLDLGKVVLSEQGKGEFVLNLEKNNIEIKGIALLYEKRVPLIGFKGSKIENYEEILFTSDDEYEEIEYIDEDEDMDNEEDEDMDNEEDEDMDDDEYEDEDDDINEYEEIEYIEIEEEDDENEENEYIEIEEEEDENEEDEYIEIPEQNEDNKYEEYNNVEEALERNLYKNQEKLPEKNKKKAHSQQQKSNQPCGKSNPKSQYPRTAGALLMPRQIKKGLKYFNEVKPFINDDIADTRWWKIEVTPTTLCGYTMPCLGYVNSLNYTMYSDAVMHSYKYRHYLFGVQYDEYNKRKRYIYAIPGNKDEQPDKGYTGFRNYKPCDTRNDSLGYWLCFIDSRTRRILK